MNEHMFQELDTGGGEGIMDTPTQIALMLDSKPFTAKPTSREVAGIKRRFAAGSPVRMDLSQLEQAILQGRTITPAVLQGGAGAQNWVQQQLFGVDVDNTDKQHRPTQPPLDAAGCLKRTKGRGFPPALLYATFSSTPELLKFRAYFVSSRVITDPKQRDSLQRALHALLEPYADSACINADRMFFGGREILYRDRAALFDPDKLLAWYEAQAAPMPPSPPKPQRETDPSLDACKHSFDFLGYLQRITGTGGRRSGNRIGFDPCPICGHRGDFYFYPESNTFYCFSASGRVGGSIIDFLMAREHLDKGQAIRKLKYDLLGMAPEKSPAPPLHAPVQATPELPPYILEQVNQRTGEVRQRVSRPLLAEYIRRESFYLFVRGGAKEAVQRYWYRDGVYAPISDEELQGYIKGFIQCVDPSLVEMKDVKEVQSNLCTDLNFVDPEELDADEGVINFRNGLLRLDTMQLEPHSPEVRSTIQIPCRWNPQPGEAPVFKRFLQQLAGFQGETMGLLKQFIGACLSNVRGYRFKKALFLVGPGNTGKSQLKALAERLIGRQNCASIDLSALEERFGSAALHRKRLCGSSDMSFVSVRELKVFKEVTGGDSIHAEHKGERAFDFTYKGLLWFCMNELPKFGGDTGDWVYDRILIVACTNVIPPQEQDKHLLDKLYAEREEIVRQCILAFREAYQNGYRFSIPESCQTHRREYQFENNVVWGFYRECCLPYDPAAGRRTEKTKLYRVFRAWCRDNSRAGYVPSNQQFKKDLAQAAGVSLEALECRTSSARCYGLGLNQETIRDYGGEAGIYGTGASERGSFLPDSQGAPPTL